MYTHEYDVLRMRHARYIAEMASIGVASDPVDEERVRKLSEAACRIEAEISARMSEGQVAENDTSVAHSITPSTLQDGAFALPRHIADVLRERERQTEKWGKQNHTLGNWGLVLTEEVGEWSEAALHTQFGGPKAAELRDEIVQVAAVALQIIEWIDNHGLPKADAAQKPPPTGTS